MKKPAIFLVAIFILFTGITSSIGRQTVSDEARRNFDLRMAALEMAKSPADHELAIKEFALAQEKAGKYSDTIPNINKLEYKHGSIAEDTSIDAQDGSGETPLHIAARKGEKEEAALLIAKGADVNAKDKDGKTPLHEAARLGQREVAELLIGRGADVNARDRSGSTPLQRAVSEDRGAVAELLIMKGADVNAKDHSGKTPLHSTAVDGKKEVAELLIAKGADVDAKDQYGKTPLHEAVINAHVPGRTGQKEVAELLIAKGADVNAQDQYGETPLHSAAYSGPKEMAELLIAKGADVNAQDQSGQTPLHTAARTGQKEVAELLIAKGADINAKDKDGMAPLQRAVDSKHSDSKGKEIEELLTAAQEQRKNANVPLVEATRKVIRKRSDSPSARLAEINTLKYAFIDPNTGRVSFIGTYDPAYASGPIPYADLLAEALDNPYPAFSLDEGSSKPARQAIKQLFDKEMRHIATDLDYGVKWMQNVLLTILNSREPIPEKLVIDQRLKQLGIEPRELAAYLDLKKSNANITSEGQYRLVSNFLGKLFASVGIEERYGKAVGILIMTRQMVMRGEEDKAIADGLYKELGELLGLIDQMQRPMNMRQLWVMFYGSLLKGMGVPPGQVNAMANRVDIHRSSWDSELAPALDARYVALAKEAFQRNILKSFVLTQAFLKRMYSLPTVYSNPKLYGKRADSPLMRVMFDADYALKYVTTLNPDTAALPGYLSAVEFLSAAAERLGRSDELKEGEVREWIYPGELRLEPFTDNSGVRFASATLRIGVEPLDDASKKKSWLWPVLNEYASRLNQRYDDYAHLYPSLYVMRETEKVIALARWIKQNRLKVDVPKARSVANPVPDRVEGFIDIIFVRKAACATDDLFLRADGGVVFDQNEGDGWIKIQPSVTTTRDVMQQLAASVALAEQASAAALSGNLESARDLAQLSADAMIGQIDISRLPEPVPMPVLAEGAASGLPSAAEQASVSLAALGVVESNTTAISRARSGLAAAEPLKTADPEAYKRALVSSRTAEEKSRGNLNRLNQLLAAYRKAPVSLPDAAVIIAGLEGTGSSAGAIFSPPRSGAPAAEAGQQPAVAQDWPSRMAKWSSELEETEKKIATTRVALLRLNAAIQVDRKQYEQWEQDGDAAFDRCVNMAGDIAVDFGVGGLSERYDTMSELAKNLPGQPADVIEKYRHLVALATRMSQAKATNDLANLAARENKTEAELYEALRDGVGQLAGLLQLDKTVPGKVWKYGSLASDLAYNLTELRLGWKAVTSLQENTEAQREAVKKLGEMMRQLVETKKALRAKIEAEN